MPARPPSSTRFTLALDRICRDCDYALCTIRDAGTGLAAGDETRIFQPFFTKRPGGTGLGLSIVKQTIEEHGGKITAADHPEGGAEFSVRLPLAN
jgi:signal transduction histidine kinase